MQNEFESSLEIIKKRASELLADGTVTSVIGWSLGDFHTDITPTVFRSVDELDGFVYDRFCAANQSKYLIEQTRKGGRVLAVLKPCDTYGFNLLVKEHRINRSDVYAIGVECDGMIDVDKLHQKGIKGICGVSADGDEFVINTLYGEKRCSRNDVLLEKCLCCKGGEHMAYDELTYTPDESASAQTPSSDCFELVEKLEKMTADERFEFWRAELSKCIRCNACRNVCPACTCEQCVFDDPQSGAASKAPVDDFEENLFHIIRAFHVAGRCTDCGECSRVCPQNIPLHLINRKLIKDINELYGTYQSGADDSSPSPLTSYTKEDCEPSVVKERGNA